MEILNKYGRLKYRFIIQVTMNSSVVNSYSIHPLSPCCMTCILATKNPLCDFYLVSKAIQQFHGLRGRARHACAMLSMFPEFYTLKVMEDFSLVFDYSTRILFLVSSR